MILLRAHETFKKNKYSSHRLRRRQNACVQYEQRKLHYVCYNIWL